MKRFCLQCLLLILFIGFAFSVFAEENAQRQWKSVSGRVIMTGTFEKFNPTDSTSIYIRSSNGKLYQYPYEKLSKEDKEFIQSLENEDPDLVEVEEAPEENNTETSKARGNGNSNSKAAKETGKRYALLVGVNNYLDLNQLECAVADIQLIQEKLLQLGFDSENIRMYITGNSIGKYPDKKTVEAGFKEILKEADENSQIFIAFAGHGFVIDNVSYFAVEDTRTDSEDDLKKTAINVNAMLEELHNCKASSKWFIVDACREYMIPKRSSSLPKISRGINSAASGNLPEGVFFLQSCKIGEASYEDNGNGLFTRCFADALDGKADANQNGELTVLEVFEYVYTNVKKYALENLNKRQTPTFSIPENTPNFTIVYIPNLQQHGLPNKEWDRVQKLYDESLILFADNKKDEGLKLLDQAMDIMKNADEDAPLKRRIKIVAKQIRNSIEERKKLEEELEKERASARNQPVSNVPATNPFSSSLVNTQSSFLNAQNSNISFNIQGLDSVPQTTGVAQVPNNAQDIPEIQAGLNALQNNDVEGCLKKFKEARITHPEFSPEELMLAKLALQIDPQKNGAGARMLIERCIKNHPDDPEAFIFLGDYNLGNGSITEAFLNFKQAGYLLTKFQGNQQRKSAMVRQFNAGMAMVYERRGENENAKDYMENYLKSDPQNVAGMQQLARIYLNMGKVNDAIAMLAKARAIKTDILVPEAIVAMYYHQKGEKNWASTYMNRALQKAPNDLNTRLAAAQWYQMNNNIDQAIRQANYALQINPQSEAAMLLRGNFALIQKDYAKAIELFNRILVNSPSNFAVANNLALALCETGRPADLKRAVELAGVNAQRFGKEPVAFSTLGYVLLKNGEVDKSLQMLNQGLQLSGGRMSPDNAYYLCAAMAAKGAPEGVKQAKEILTKTLESTPSFNMRPEAERLKAKLDRY